MEATGSLTIGESTAALACIKTRRGLSPRQAKAIVVACMLAVGIPLGRWITGSWGTAAISVEFALLGIVVGVVIVQRLAGPSTNRALAARGQKVEQPLKVRMTSEALIYDLDELTMTARWSCVTAIYRTRSHWVFLVQSSAMVLPRRFFQTRDAERDFIVEAWSRIDEPARTRSPDARMIVGTVG